LILILGSNLHIIGIIGDFKEFDFFLPTLERIREFLNGHQSRYIGKFITNLECLV
jgi:hypothetical protein